jgi:RimJ/RimL family protein N-acetyltransferase
MKGTWESHGMAATQNASVDAGDLITFGDGTEAVVRPMSAADSAALLRFHGHLSARSVRRRFFYPHMVLSPDEVARFTQVDGEARVALVVECAGELVAVGRYDRLDDRGVAEVAFVVADEYQHQGLGTMLLHRLANAARSVGIERFTAEVLAENRPMLSVFQNAGFPIESKTELSIVDLMMSIGSDLTDTATD